MDSSQSLTTWESKAQKDWAQQLRSESLSRCGHLWPHRGDYPQAPSDQGIVEQESWCFFPPAKRVHISGEVEVQTSRFYSLISESGLRSPYIPTRTQHYMYQAAHNWGVLVCPCWLNLGSELLTLPHSLTDLLSILLISQWTAYLFCCLSQLGTDYNYDLFFFF